MSAPDEFNSFSPADLVSPCEIVLLAVKPNVLVSAVTGLGAASCSANLVFGDRLISIKKLTNSDQILLISYLSY